MTAGSLSFVYFALQTPRYSNFLMLEGLHQATLGAGYDSRLFEIGLEGQGLDGFLAHMAGCDPQETVLVDLNGRMRMPQVAPFRRVAFLCDHPFKYMDIIRQLPDHTLLTVLDHDHQNFLQRMGLGRRSCIMPHGGPEPLPQSASSPRNDRMLFIGNLVYVPTWERLKAVVDEAPDPVNRIMLEMAEAADGTLVPLLDLFEDTVARHGLSVGHFEEASVQDIFVVMEHWREARRRQKVLAALEGLPLDIVGQVDPAFFPTAPQGLRMLGQRTFVEVLELMRQYGLLLNTVGCFLNGSHERIWYAMSRQCPVLTDQGSLFERDFKNGETISLIPDDLSELGEQVAGLLDNPGGLARMAEQALDPYRAGHTWSRRFSTILDALK